MPNTTRWAVPDNLPQKMFIDGQWVASSSARMIETIDPATETVIGCFPDVGGDDVDRAVASAKAASDVRRGWLQWRVTIALNVLPRA